MKNTLNMPENVVRGRKLLYLDKDNYHLRYIKVRVYFGYPFTKCTGFNATPYNKSYQMAFDSTRAKYGVSPRGQ